MCTYIPQRCTHVDISELCVRIYYLRTHDLNIYVCMYVCVYVCMYGRNNIDNEYVYITKKYIYVCICMYVRKENGAMCT